MEIFLILAIGFGSGLLFSILSIALLNSVNAERFPLGGFLPALLVVADLGNTSQIVRAGCLVMGGLLGYYLILALWRGMPKQLSEVLPGHAPAHHEDPDDSVSTDKGEEEVIRGRNLADFL